MVAEGIPGEPMGQCSFCEEHKLAWRRTAASDAGIIPLAQIRQPRFFEGNFLPGCGI